MPDSEQTARACIGPQIWEERVARGGRRTKLLLQFWVAVLSLFKPVADVNDIIGRNLELPEYSFV